MHRHTTHNLIRKIVMLPAAVCFLGILVIAKQPGAGLCAHGAAVYEGACDANNGEGTVSEPIPYTVTFQPNGVGCQYMPGAQTKIHGTDLNLSMQQPVAEGYRFLGWSKEQETVLPEYEPGDVYAEDQDVTLYAVWERVTYRIQYDANEGSDAPESETKSYNSVHELSEMQPVRDGFYFAGWAESDNSSDILYEAGDRYYGNGAITLYAIWKPLAQTEIGIWISANGGEFEDPYGGAEPCVCETVRFDRKEYAIRWVKLSRLAVTREGYTFLGWYDENNNPVAAMNAEELTEAQGHVLQMRAQWMENRSMEYNGYSGKYSILLRSQVPHTWTVTSDCSWIDKLSVESAARGTKVSFFLTGNYGETRTGTINLTDSLGTTVTIPISQTSSDFCNYLCEPGQPIDFLYGVFPLLRHGTTDNTLCTDAALADLMQRKLARDGKLGSFCFFEYRDILKANWIPDDGSQSIDELLRAARIESAERDGTESLCPVISLNGEKLPVSERVNAAFKERSGQVDFSVSTNSLGIYDEMDKVTYRFHLECTDGENSKIRFREYREMRDITEDMGEDERAEAEAWNESVEEDRRANRKTLAALLKEHPDGLYTRISYTMVNGTERQHTFLITRISDGVIWYLDNGWGSAEGTYTATMQYNRADIAESEKNEDYMISKMMWMGWIAGK